MTIRASSGAFQCHLIYSWLYEVKDRIDVNLNVDAPGNVLFFERLFMNNVSESDMSQVLEQKPSTLFHRFLFFTLPKK